MENPFDVINAKIDHLTEQVELLNKKALFTEKVQQITLPYMPVNDFVATGLASRGMLYKLRDKGKFQFKYILSKQYVDMEQFYSLMANEPEGDEILNKMTDGADKEV